MNYLTLVKTEILTPGPVFIKKTTPSPAPASANIVDSFQSPLQLRDHLCSTVGLLESGSTQRQ